MVDECPRCGWPQDQVYEVLSRHVTSEGVVSYTRCACGEIQVRVHPYRRCAEAGDADSPMTPASILFMTARSARPRGAPAVR